MLNGTKRATAGLLSEYIAEHEPWEHVGERLVLVDDDATPLGISVAGSLDRARFAAHTEK